MATRRSGSSCWSSVTEWSTTSARNTGFKGGVVKIAVCIKRVPDTETRIRIGADGKSIDEAGVKFVINPYDEFAIEEALKRKEGAGSGEVVVVALGNDSSQETIRTALAMGADRGVLLK